MLSTARFLRHYLRPGRDTVLEGETTYRRGDETLEATVYRPAAATGALPAWVVLHGLTARGRHHPNLQRFVRAMAASGTVVLVPEIPEWRRLEVAAGITVPTIRDAVLAVDGVDGVDPDRTAVLGFSFGATQALIASADPALRGKLQGVAAWGGYCNPGEAFRFAMTGEHQWQGVRYRGDPDPYGRWIIAANYLTAIPGHEGDDDVARALHDLALEAGESGIGSWDPRFDGSKARLRAALHGGRKQELFDTFAPRTDVPPPDRDRALAMARRLTRAAMDVDPLLDPGPYLSRVGVRTYLAHGRHDRLVPFTSMYCLRASLPATAVVGSGLTALFAHSGGADPALGLAGRLKETWRFLAILNGVLNVGKAA